jgi:hypothetical protein
LERDSKSQNTWSIIFISNPHEVNETDVTHTLQYFEFSEIDNLPVPLIESKRMTLWTTKFKELHHDLERKLFISATHNASMLGICSRKVL